MAYCTVAEIRERLSLGGSQDDNLISDLIDTADSLIDNYTGRTFNSSTETRKFDGNDSNKLLLNDDLISMSAIEIDAVSKTITDFILYPLNSSPKRFIIATLEKGEIFTKGRANIEITGDWGYCALASLPRDIWNACVKLVTTEYIRRQSASAHAIIDERIGYVAFADGLPKDVQQILSHYQLPSFS